MTVQQTVDADKFAVAMSGILNAVEWKLTDNLDEPVKEACKAAKKKASGAATPNYKDRPTKRGMYRKGFAYKVDKRGRYESMGYVGNRLKPGLVHLLEKGHATMRGGRTRSFKHMEPAAQEGSRVLVAEAEKLVDRALS